MKKALLAICCVSALAMGLLLGGAALAQSGLPVFTQLAENASPAVVNISTVTVYEGGPSGEFNFEFHGEMEPFNEFFDQFEDFFNSPYHNQPFSQESLGSGFIISADGYIVTNFHVIEGADEVKVNLQGLNREGQSFDAEIIGRDQETDLALLKIETDQELPVLSFGDSEALRVGEWVMAIGNPFGLDHTVTAGIVSAKGRIIGSGPYDDYIQTDASINPGNSGGPLLNMNGEVIGINTAIVASGQGIGFAIPSNMAQNVINQLRDHQSVERGWIGVTIQELDGDSARALGLDETRGALVASVLEGQPAEEAGMLVGDVIISVNGQDITDTSDLLRKIADLPPGESASITVWRGGEAVTLTIVLGRRDLAQQSEEEEQQPAVEEPQSETAALGLSMRPLNQNEAMALGMPQPVGLLILGVDPNSPAIAADVRPGDVILAVNQQAVDSVQAFNQAIEAATHQRGVAMLLMMRGGTNVFRTIPLQ
ncbi:MAG: DegQ family serine endoprotease [Desulfovibrio sp.]|nr:MAG: DegQ family serine endoprotease [Desulfovibrio sp.]